jgi:hypothetical protein
LPPFHVDGMIDMQNMASPASLHSELRKQAYCWYTLRFSQPLGSRNLADTGLNLVHYLNIFTLPDFLAFLYNLPLFLEAQPSVNNFLIHCDLPTNGRSHLPDSPHHTQFDLVPIPYLSGFKAVYALVVTCTSQTGFGQVMLFV